MKRPAFKPIKQSSLRRALLHHAGVLFNALDFESVTDRVVAVGVAARVERGRVSALRFTLVVPSLWPAVSRIDVELPMPHPLLTFDKPIMLSSCFWRRAGLPDPAGCDPKGFCADLARGTWLGVDSDSLRIVDMRRGRPCPTTVECRLSGLLDAAKLDETASRFCAAGRYD